MYSYVYNYCKDISQNLGVSVKWVHEDKTWLSLITPDQPITCWSLPFVSSGNPTPNWNRVWTLNFIFYQQDEADSSMDMNDQSKEQESIRTLANTDAIAERFLRQFSRNEINDELELASDLLTVNSFTTSPAIRDTTQQLTGTLLTMNVTFSDGFNYCCL